MRWQCLKPLQRAIQGDPPAWHPKAGPPIKSGAGFAGIRYAPRMKKQDRFERVAGRIAAAPRDGLQLAMAAIQNRRPDEAERIARDLLSRDSQSPAALHVFGLALLAQQRPREAIAPLEQAARGRPDPMIETHLAIALRQIGRGADALKWLEQATARQPAFAFAFHELGVLLFSQRRLPEAEAVLKQGLEIAPTMHDPPATRTHQRSPVRLPGWQETIEKTEQIVDRPV